MADTAPVAWHHLFVSGDASQPEALVKFQMVRRSGGVVLALPSDGSAAACALKFFDELLPSPPATKGALALAFKLKLPTGLEKFSMPIEREEPFAAFLTKAAGGRRFPEFAIESSSGTSPGRYLILVFNEKHEPAAIVKAGVGQEAKDFIGDEAWFLESAPRGTPGVPRLSGALRDSRVEALAMEFVPGEPPTIDDEAGVARLLTAWIDTTRELPLCQIFPWQMLEAACESESPSKAMWPEIRDRKCHPVMFNGDFAPWMMRLTPGGWVGLNWERGETAGVPGWDWFHYIVQASCLARGESAAAAAMRVERLLGSAAFQGYARKSKIAGLERGLVVAYLDYATSVLRAVGSLTKLQEVKARLLEPSSKPA
jgi:hypothetical protein